MAGRFSTFLKGREPVLVVFTTNGNLTIIMSSLGLDIKYATRIKTATPYNYSVPVRENGNMPDVPSHPQDPQGPSMEKLKNDEYSHR
ncbi:NADH dehydrogenase [ubiquinone] 1 alpha subcomplex subunit 3-like [Cricetulus griseus]|uniref:NADH dehydrogenase [ubiquinone] 1 alpha subcomplex subunit 3 n=1 Tax=Cricetulus griseus TaxID=10029 RepID=A0A9J7GRQ8_CRIGR|nr:NADH dehydrogenase [ubiquinone] 1 alpha subcomplex subunit 3-like [Cricetulus griseus]